MNLSGKFLSARRALVALSFALVGVTTGAYAQSVSEVDQALADLYPVKAGFTPPSLIVSGTTALPTAAQLQLAIQLIASGTGVTVTAAGHSAHAGLGLPQNAAGDIGAALGSLGAQSAATTPGDMLAGYYAATSGDNALMTEYLPAVTGSAAAYGNFTTMTADASEKTIVSAAISDSKPSAAAILDAALAVTDPAASAQAALFVAEAATTGLSANLNSLASSLAASAAIKSGSTGAFLAFAVKDESMAANQVSLLEGYTTGYTDNTLVTTAQNLISATASSSISLTDANLVDVFSGLTSGATGDVTVIQGVIKAVLASSSFTTAALQSTYVGDAITAFPTQLVNIMSAALSFNSASPASQVTIFTGNATAAHLTADGGLSLGQLATDIGGTTDIGGGVLTNATTGSFLEGVIKAETSGSAQQAFLEGYIAGVDPSGPAASDLATTATNIIAAAPASFTPASRMSVFVGLVTAGTSGNTNTLAAVLPGITTGILAGETTTADTAAANDTAITALVAGATGMINTYPTEAGLIAQYAAKTVQATSDVFAFTAGVLANANVKSVGGTNGIVDVTQAISDDYTLGDITVTTGNIQAKEGAVEAGIKALTSGQVLTGSAAQIVSQAVAQVVTDGSANGSLVTFATNFITAIDNKSIDTNFAAITAADRAYAAIGLVEACDTNSIAGASAAVAAAAVTTWDSSIVDLNGVAQPILAYLSVNNSAVETGSAAAAIAQIPGSIMVGANTITFNPAYLAAQLILGAKTGTAPNGALVDQIALGTAASSSLLTDGYGASKDTYLSALAGNLTGAVALPFLKDMALYLATAPSYTDTEIVGDFASGLTAVPASTTANSLESGTIAAIVAAESTADAAAIAHAAAANVGADTVRDVIAEDVLINVSSAAVAISGSVAETITGVSGNTTYTQGYDLAVLAANLVKLDTTHSDDSAMALNIANALPSNDSDTAGLEADLANIVKNSVPTTVTADKTATNVAAIAENIALNYTGTLSSNSGSLGGYSNVALYAKDILIDFPAVTSVTGAASLSDDLAAGLVPAMINANSNSVSTAELIAGQFVTDLPTSSLAIATAATQSSLYSNYNAEESGTIGATIAADLALAAPAALTSKVPALTGSIALISAVAGAGTSPVQSTINSSLQDVAGVFASNSGVQSTTYTSIATSLGAFALATGGTYNALHTLTIPSIFSAFASASTLGSTAASVEKWLTPLLGSAAGQLHDYNNAADIFGVALEADPAIQAGGFAPGSLFVTLEGAIATDIGAAVSAAGWQALIAEGGPFAGDNSNTTLTTLKNQLDTLLLDASTAATNGEYGNITANETPIVNM